MRRVTAEQHYGKTISLEDGLSYEINIASPHNRFKVLQKHIRFQVLNAIVQHVQSMDLKRYILELHHEGEQLSQRDITEKVKRMVSDMPDEEKLEIIRRVYSEIWRELMEMRIADCRKDLKAVFTSFASISEAEKRVIYNMAIENSNGHDFLDKLKTFDNKTIAEFIRVFQLDVRDVSQKWDGKTTKQKLSKHRTDGNRKMWDDPNTRRHLCTCIKKSWSKRKKPAAHSK